MSPAVRRTLVLLGALVLTLVPGLTPGAAAAAPAGYRIVSVVAVSAGPDSVGCAVDVTTTYRLPEVSEATYMRFYQFRLPDIASSSPTVSLDEATQVGVPPPDRPWDVRWQLTQRFAEVGLDDASRTWIWGAQLLSGYWDDGWVTTPLTQLALTKPFHGRDGICPPVGKVIAKGH